MSAPILSSPRAPRPSIARRVAPLLLSCACGALTACDADAPDDGAQGGGTTAQDGRFTPAPGESQPSQGSGASQQAPAQQGGGASQQGGGNGGASTPSKPASSDGTCASPRCFGAAGICGCQGGEGAGATILACVGGKCRCGDKTLDANGACGQQANEQALRALFAQCGCK